MENKEYLYRIHNKIKIVKIKKTISTSIPIVSLFIISFLLFDNKINEDLLFDNYYDSFSVYEWEIDQELSDIEVYDYLIETTCIEDYDTIENEQLLEMSRATCYICFNNEVDICLQPCGHAFCSECCLNATINRCPSCRALIRGRLNLYL